VEVQLHVFSISALDEGECPTSRPGRFTPRERAAGTHWIRDWVGHRAVVDAVIMNRNEIPGNIKTNAPTG